MKHGLGVDVLACACGLRMKYVATIFDKKGPAHPPSQRPHQQDFDFGP